MRPIKHIESIYKKAEKNTRFEPTYYLIYDRSTPDECNRLVRVMPFNWVIWAINSNIFIIETTGAAVCPSGTTPAIQVLSDIYSMSTTCVTVLFQSILNLYPDKPHKIFFDIEKSSVKYKFTILDALNDLLENYLTISFNNIPEQINRLILNESTDTDNIKATKDVLTNSYEYVKPQHMHNLWKRLLTSRNSASEDVIGSKANEKKRRNF